MKKLGLVVVALGVMVGLGGIVTQPVLAEDPPAVCDDPNISAETKLAAGCSNPTLCEDTNIAPELREAAGCEMDRNKTIMPVVVALIQVVLAAVGVLAVGVMIYGGITYTISTGDSAKTTKAKNIILYGVIGLVVAMMAYAIVTFVSKSLGGA